MPVGYPKVMTHLVICCLDSGAHEEGKMGPVYRLDLTNVQKMRESDRPLMQEVSKSVNDIGLAEFVLNEGHYVR
jgi:hypothetical protein